MNADPSTNAVALFIYVPGYGWVTKPTCAAPLTAIQANGTWTNRIVTGGSDQLATRIAALLVNTNYNQPCVAGSNALPASVYAQAVASAIVTRQSPGVRWLSFSGYDWWVKTSPGSDRVGPGPNYFSDSTNNVWVDVQGWLHARITNRSNQWQCAELVTARTFGYGSYRFELASRVDNLDPNVVLGLFTWSDDPAFTDREIDLECSRWSNAADTNNAQFVVQPDAPGHKARLAIPAGLTNSTLLFTWETNQVSFQSLQGSYSPAPAAGDIISNWTYSLTVPQTGDENVRVNLWLNQGQAPTDNQEVEVIIKSFEFVPLGQPQASLLDRPARLPDNSASFGIQQMEPDRRYLVQGSTNLLDWQSLATILATNSRVEFLDSNPAAPDREFYRVLSLP